MGALKDNITQLGKTVADSVDAPHASARVISGARQRFQDTLDEGVLDEGVQGRPQVLVLAPWIGAAVLVCSLFGYLAIEGLPTWFAQKGPLTVSLEERETELVGSWIAAEDETKQLRFSDGTVVSLHPHTKLQVEGTTSAGATIVLSEGRALAQVEPLPGARWSVLAGPFTIRVTGTAFDVAWFPQKGTFEIALHQGSVTLTGPSIKGTKDVRKGDFVRIELPDASKSVAPELGGPVTTQAEDSAESAEQPPKNTGASSGVRRESSWRSFLATGEVKEALWAIDRVGSKAALEDASAEELWALSDAARVGGRPTLARDALLALRKKHGTRGQTAYLLGKVYADQLNSPAEAIRWFDTYLSESPKGSLAEQALGRLVELQAGTSRGRRAARTYLERYPNGSYAQFARSSSR